jgi:hypothetical protein
MEIFKKGVLFAWNFTYDFLKNFFKEWITELKTGFQYPRRINPTAF